MPALYDSIGAGYGRTRRADPELAETLARLLALPAGGRGLDLACGSGNYTLAMAARGGHWTGLDESATMLAQAARTAAPVVWVRGDASALPFADDSFDAVLCTLAIHHFGALDAPFAELRRVLRPGGRCVIFTAFAEQMQAYWLGRYFPRMMALSMQKMPSCAAVLKALGDAGFAGIERLPYHVSAGLQDLFLYAGKHRPQLYLDAAVRANISSFATLCAAQELAAGLDALRADLAHGRWAGVAADAPAEGDYAFVIVRK
jgi:ubiquinone/menaquinone biosynthesis C-methylase UbiE